MVFTTGDLFIGKFTYVYGLLFEVWRRDLKLDNLLLAHEGYEAPVKVIDFGYLVQLDHGTDTFVDHVKGAVGTPGMFAPESLEQYEYSAASDVWQLGCILYWYAN